MEKNSLLTLIFTVSVFLPLFAALHFTPCIIPGLGRSPGGGNGNPLQYSYLENSMDRGAWQAVVHEVTKNWT